MGLSLVPAISFISHRDPFLWRLLLPALCVFCCVGIGHGEVARMVGSVCVCVCVGGGGG